MFDADHPIVKSSQDKLGRATFAKYLARCILDQTSQDSLVLGLEGSWGAGKTSIINLCLEELQIAANHALEQEQPILLNFNPWLYSGQAPLLVCFLRRLSAEMRRADYLTNKAEIISLLELYISFFTHQPIPKAVQPKHALVMKSLNPKKFSEKTIGWESGRDLALVKAEINKLLRASRHKIIIMIDNIARLPATEMQAIFQMVKAIADFANTVYVLALDKAVVMQALNKLQLNGAEYLAKIIQLPFSIPAIAKQDLEQILFARLQPVMRLVPVEAWDRHAWADLYYTSLQYFFNDCRDITRYVNTLHFGYQHVKDVVNPVDFFAITALQVFEPEIFYGVRDNKDLFTDLLEDVYVEDAKKLAEDKGRVEEILQRVVHIPKALVQVLLMQIFPRLLNIYRGANLLLPPKALTQQNLRVSSLDVFDRYFRLTVANGEITESEFKAILAIAHDAEGFDLTLMRLNQDERIQKFLTLLDGNALGRLPKESIPNVVRGLVDGADLFPEGHLTLLSLNTPMRIHRIIQKLLHQFTARAERFTIMSLAFTRATNSIYYLVFELHALTEQQRLLENALLEEIYVTFSVEQLHALQKIVCDKLAYWAKIGRLAEHPHLLALLDTWKVYDSEAAFAYVDQLVQDERGLLQFLRAVLKVPIRQMMTKLAFNPAWNNYLDIITGFIALPKVLPHAERLFEDISFEKLSEEEQLAILIFLNLMKSEKVKVVPKTVG